MIAPLCVINIPVIKVILQRALNYAYKFSFEDCSTIICRNGQIHSTVCSHAVVQYPVGIHPQAGSFELGNRSKVLLTCSVFCSY